jgi:hypothetical protein
MERRQITSCYSLGTGRYSVVIIALVALVTEKEEKGRVPAFHTLKIAVISGEVEEAVSQGVEMVAELVQPRMSIVR